jgi:putative transposase
MTTAARCGAGSFLRSMRFGVIGNEARVTIARGIMYSGMRVRRCASASKRSLDQGTETVPMAPNDRWSLDFLSDQLTGGRRFRVLTVDDDCARECLALVADTSLSGTRVELDRLLIERGKPKMMVCDNGSELTSNAILIWADQGRICPRVT